MDTQHFFGETCECTDLFTPAKRVGLKTQLEEVNILNDHSIIDFWEKFRREIKNFHSMVILFSPPPKKIEGSKKLQYFQSYVMTILGGKRIEIRRNYFESILTIEYDHKDICRFTTHTGEGLSVFKNIFLSIF